MSDNPSFLSPKHEDIRENGGYEDIEEISKNSGIKNTQLLKKFKDHVFYSKNVLPDSNGIEINFTPDIDIAYVWKYAQDGVKFTSEQRAWFLKLMRHEVSEARYIKRGFPFRNLENPNSKINSAHFSAPTPPRNSFPDYDARNWRWWSGIK